MSKRQTLRGFVNERLAAAANEIFVLVERTITEYEEELCRFKEENRRKQQLLDLVLRSQAPGPSAEVHAPVLDHVLGPDAAEVQTECISQKKESSETLHTQVKEEPLEKSIKQEEGQFPEFTVCYVESEEQTSLRHTQPEPKDPQGEDKRRANSSSNPHGYVYSEYGQSDSDPSAHSSTTQHNTFTVEEDDHCKKIQTKYRNAAAHYSAQGTSHTSAPETSGIPMDENMSSVRIKEEPLEESIKEEEGQFPEFKVCYVESEEQMPLQHTQTELKDPQGEDTRRANSSSNPHGYVYSEYGQSHSDPSAHSSTAQISHNSARGTSNTYPPETSGILMDENRSGKRNVECSICRETFKTLFALRKHRLVHTSVKCNNTCAICNKTFTQRGHLNVHMRIHTGERPYSCSVCDKTFVQKSALNVHRRTHTGETPFSCSVCHKRFTDWSSHKRHVLTHTSQPP